MNQLLEENSVRVFFALWPNKEERTALAAWQPTLHAVCGGRIMRDNTLHTTLVFLGEVELSRLETLQLAAQEVTGKSFDLVLESVRYWGHNHIVYAAPNTVPPQLAQLVQDLEQRLLKHHFHFEKREYKPHITLLRHAQWSDLPLPGNQHLTKTGRTIGCLQSLR
jgi:2'-5' RNA ligase